MVQQMYSIFERRQRDGSVVGMRRLIVELFTAKE
jgi:hypothetical protein